MSTDVSERMRFYRWVVFWVLAGGYILVYFHRLAPAVVAVDMMRDLQTGGSLTGFLGAAYFYPYALMQLPAGLLSDSWGPRNTISTFFLVAFAGSLVLAAAPSAMLAIAGRTLVGIGVAMLFVPTLKVLSEWFSTQEFVRMTGLLMLMGGIGSLISTAPLAYLSSAIGWRGSFLVVAGLTLALMILVRLFVFDRPADKGWPSPTHASAQSQIQVGLWAGVRQVLACPYFWPMAVWFFCDAGIFFTFGGLWGGPFLMHLYGLSKAQAGQVLSMMALGLIIGSPFQAWLSNTVFKARKPVVVLSTIIVCALTAVLAFLPQHIPMPGLYLICLGLGVFPSAVVVVVFTMTKEMFPVHMAGTSTGLINLFPFAGGAVLQPVLGAVLEAKGRVGDGFSVAGYRAAFSILFAAALVALVCSLFLKETLTKPHEA